MMSFDRTFAGPQPAGLILAGGAGRRMGGVDKAGLRLNDETLLDRALRRIAPQVDLIALSVGGDMARAAGHHIAALPDPQAYLGDGPLSGVLAGLVWAQANDAVGVVSLAVDTPFFPDDLAARLSRNGDFTVAFAGGRLHPTFGYWPCRLRGPLEDALASGHRRLGDFAAAQGAAKVEFPDAAAFFNINTPDDLAQARVREAGL